MALVSYQTITLSKGKHDSPEDGACAMELASMLASEPFSDHPQSVCPVIGSFLRAYNDWIDDRRRQDLYAYAAKVVGSRGSQNVQQARTERVTAWALELHWSAWLQRAVPARLRALIPTPPAELVGSHAVCAIRQHTDKTHAEVLALIDELLRIGARKPPTEPPEKSPAPSPQSDRGRCSLAVSADAGLLPTTSTLDVGWLMFGLGQATLILGALLGQGLLALPGPSSANEDDL